MANFYDVNAAIQKPNIVQSFQAGQELGERQRIRSNQETDLSNLRNLAPQVMAGDPGAFAQATAIDPKAAQQYQTAGDDQLRRVKGMFNYIDNALKTGNPRAVEGAWREASPFLERMGMPPGTTFEQARPFYEQAKAKIAMLGAGPSDKGVVVSSGGALVNPTTGKTMYQSPEKAPDAVRTLQALHDNPELADFDLQRRAASRPVTNINTGTQENAFQKALGQKDADAFVKMRDQATQAASTLTQADQLELILGAQKTGKVQEALAMAGQYFGTDAGANLQALKGVIQPLVLSQVKQLGSGTGISDADRKFIESGMPGFGNDPRANERVLRIMRQTAQRKIDLYKQADEYVQKNGRLGGFRSALITPEAPAGAAARPRAVNQQTGQVVEFDGSQWVPVDGR